MVTRPSVPERRAVNACVSWTSGSMAKPRWPSRAGRRKRRLTAGQLFRWRQWSSKPARRRSPPERSESAACKVAEGKLVRSEEDFLRHQPSSTEGLSLRTTRPTPSNRVSRSSGQAFHRQPLIDFGLIKLGARPGALIRILNPSAKYEARLEPSETNT